MHYLKVKRALDDNVYNLNHPVIRTPDDPSEPVYTLFAGTGPVLAHHEKSKDREVYVGAQLRTSIGLAVNDDVLCEIVEKPPSMNPKDELIVTVTKIMKLEEGIMITKKQLAERVSLGAEKCCCKTWCQPKGTQLQGKEVWYHPS